MASSLKLQVNAGVRGALEALIAQQACGLHVSAKQAPDSLHSLLRGLVRPGQIFCLRLLACSQRARGIQAGRESSALPTRLGRAIQNITPPARRRFDMMISQDATREGPLSSCTAESRAVSC